MSSRRKLHLKKKGLRKKLFATIGNDSVAGLLDACLSEILEFESFTSSLKTHQAGCIYETVKKTQTIPADVRPGSKRTSMHNPLNCQSSVRICICGRSTTVATKMKAAGFDRTVIASAAKRPALPQRPWKQRSIARTTITSSPSELALPERERTSLTLSSPREFYRDETRWEAPAPSDVELGHSGSEHVDGDSHPIVSSSGHYCRQRIDT